MAKKKIRKIKIPQEFDEFPPHDQLQDPICLFLLILSSQFHTSSNWFLWEHYRDLHRNTGEFVLDLFCVMQETSGNYGNYKLFSQPYRLLFVFSFSYFAVNPWFNTDFDNFDNIFDKNYLKTKKF